MVLLRKMMSRSSWDRARGIFDARRIVMVPHSQPAAILGRPNPFAVLFQEIAEIARSKLRRSAYVELTDVSCDFHGGTLTLSGHVPSYHMKQLAESSVAQVPGVLEINNRIEVVGPRVSPDGRRGVRESFIAAEPY
jgi:hypothetical protein